MFLIQLKRTACLISEDEVLNEKFNEIVLISNRYLQKLKNIVSYLTNAVVKKVFKTLQLNTSYE